jgi:hypothetical protein
MDYRVHTATQVVRQLWPLGECAGTTVPMSLMMHDDRDERQLDGNGKIHQRSRTVTSESQIIAVRPERFSPLHTCGASSCSDTVSTLCSL